jgi:hypothetical protein
VDRSTAPGEVGVARSLEVPMPDAIKPNLYGSRVR